MTEGRKLDLSDWSFYTSPCPCCGGEADWDYIGNDSKGWWHASNLADVCRWDPEQGDTPCENWPHTASPAQVSDVE